MSGTLETLLQQLLVGGRNCERRRQNRDVRNLRDRCGREAGRNLERAGWFVVELQVLLNSL